MPSASKHAKEGGKVTPDGWGEIACDLPASLQLRNKGGSDGAGLCVFTSIDHAARWQRIRLLEGFRDYMTKFPGGGWPEKVDAYVNRIAREKGVPPPRYFHYSGRDLTVIRKALETGRMVCCTYCYSPLGRYGGGRIAHMVNIIYLDDKWACFLDNNFPGPDKYEWVPTGEALNVMSCGGSLWAIIFLDDPCPPLPFNRKDGVL